MKIEEKKMDEKQVAYISFKGPYDEVPVLMGEIVGFVMAKSLQIMGPPFGIYYNSPQEVLVEELVYEVGIPFAGEAQEEGRIKIKIMPAQLVLSAIHKGPYNEVGTVIGALGEHAYKNGYEIVGAPMEIYLSDPNEVAESELLTEVCFPVMKK